MSTTFDDLLLAFEVHSVEHIRVILVGGFDATTAVHGKTPSMPLSRCTFGPTASRLVCGFFLSTVPAWMLQRTEQDAYDNVKALLLAAGRVVPPLENVPNRYLAPR